MRVRRSSWPEWPEWVYGAARSELGPHPSRMRAQLHTVVRQLAALAPNHGVPSVETPTEDVDRERAPVVVIFVPSEGR